MNGLKSYFNSLVSATAIYMRLRQAVIGAFNDFKEIDSELNAISIVTGKTMKELWGNFGNLNSIAQQYGVTTKNVIEVQKLYYQQGRNAVEVTQLTGETLKFAKISGLDFANATDYMTAALNAYNIAAKDASEITDTYAALSAAAAVDSQEVAVAMSKVASMAAAAGSSFKDTSAYLSKIIEVTREAPETSGTALKTIVARFTEIDKLTED
nr:MAG TPA: minor tail protein [Caudoviricetes sp.]